MALKRIIIFIITISLTTAINAQSSLYIKKEKETEACDASLVSTFTKYFTKPAETPTKKEVSNTSRVSSFASSLYNSTVDNVISVGKTFLGIPYKWGGVSDNGFDCSGFIKHIFSWFGLNLPRTSREMANYGSYVSRDELQKGDLVFFTGRNMNSGIIGHIGIVVEVTNEAIKMMHSSSSQGVHIEDLNKSQYFSKRYLTARRLPIEQMAQSNNIH